MMRTCPKCLVDLPMDTFGVRKSGKPRSWCRPCERLRERGRRFTEKQLRRKMSLTRMQRSYWTDEGFEAAWEAQKGICPICTREMTPRGKTATSVHADHHPVRNTPRSLLCSNCNSGLGFYRDDADTLRRAADYLDFHNA